jgi:hypothetical protein
MTTGHRSRLQIAAVQKLHFPTFPPDLKDWNRDQVVCSLQCAKTSMKKLENPSVKIAQTSRHHDLADKWRVAHKTFVDHVRNHPALED